MAERNPSDDQAAFGVFPQLKRNRAKQDREAAKNVPIDLARGALAGVLGAPGDIESLVRMLPYLDEKTVLPTSEDIEKRIPLRSETPVSKAATGLGILGGGFYTGPSSPLRVVGAIPAAVRHGAEEFAKASVAGAPHVVKREGGNWIQDTIDNSIRGLKSRVSTENLANYTPEQVAQLIANNRLANNDAMNKWIESKIGRYVKSEMGTPSDPIRLLIEKREAEIADKFLKDQARANRMADRAAQEVDPRRKANLTRQAQRMLDDAVAQRDLAMEHTSHLPRGFQNVDADEFTDDVLKSVRKAEGFPEKGMGTTPSSRAWESKSDMSIYPINVGEIQSHPANKLSRQKAIEDYNAYEDKLDQDVIKYLKSKGIEGQYMAGLMKMSGEEKAALVGDTKLKELLDAIPPYSSREPIYEVAGKESYIGKLDPKSSVYSGDISGLHFDHIVDVLKQDVASGRITPEQLNKITMEQAVRRTADYDLERSVAMREAKIKEQEGFPVHKEYPDEGYKWIELTAGEKAKAKVVPMESGGWTIEDATGHQMSGGFKSKEGAERALAQFSKSDPRYKEGFSEEKTKALEAALKYEGDTMGHCVGGYCPDVVSGRSRIFSLRDTKGEPHVTIEVQPQNEKGYYNSLGSTERADLLNKAIEYRRQTVPDWDEMKNPVERADMLRDYLQAQNIEIPARIVQIKGKQNLRPIEKYDPYTQDFVMSGNWSDVGDLKNTGLISADAIRKAGWDMTGIDKKYFTKQEYDDLLRAEQNRVEGNGMKRGGVAISKNPDTMMLELGNKRMKEGGAEDDTKPYFGGAGTKKYAAAKKRAEQADVNLLKDPKTYAAIMGLLGEAPDQMGFSVLHPDYEGVRKVADPAYGLGIAAQVAPIVGPLTKGMPVGASIKNVSPLESSGVFTKAMAKADAERALPLVLPRAMPKSLAEINAHAERVARQMMGEHVTSGKAGDTTNLAGRSMKESQRVKNLDYEIVPTKDVPESQVYQPQIGDINVALPGDFTLSDVELKSLQGEPVGSRQQGGSRYGLGHLDAKIPLFYASNEVPAQGVQNKVDDLYNLFGPERVMGHHMAMGPVATNFAQHFADANLRYTDYSKLRPQDMYQFDKIISEGFVKSKKDKKTGETIRTIVDFPDWPGIADPQAALAAMESNPEMRKWYNRVMQTPKITSALNLPSGLDVRYAITSPDLRDMEVNLTGHGVGRMKPSATLTDTANHNTYAKGIQGIYEGHQEVLTPFPISFADATQHIITHYSPKDFTGTIQKVFPHQRVDQQYIDELGAYRKRIKELTGKKKGGAVKKPIKKAAGGAITGDDLIVEERPL